jgi:hypothetical protein
MKAITKQSYFFTFNDANYKSALNYDGTNYYNAPMTFTIDGKVFIVGLGVSDRETVRIHHNTRVYIVAENAPLDYISLTYIDTENNIVDSCSFSGNDLRIFGDVFVMPAEMQISLLSNYLTY